MKRFVEHFYPLDEERAIENRINDYAENFNLTILKIAPMYGNGIFVLFEEREADDERAN